MRLTCRTCVLAPIFLASTFSRSLCESSPNVGVRGSSAPIVESGSSSSWTVRVFRRETLQHPRDETLLAQYELHIHSDKRFDDRNAFKISFIDPPEAEVQNFPDDTGYVPALPPLSRNATTSLSSGQEDGSKAHHRTIMLNVTIPIKFQNRSIRVSLTTLNDKAYNLILPPPSGLLEIHLLSVNDYHGRIGTSISDGDEAVAVNLASQIERKRADYGAENCIFVSVGDLVGASQYESAMEFDRPTLEIFKELGLTCNVLGNHELMFGYDYFKEHIASSGLKLLSANVVEEGSLEPIVDGVMSVAFNLPNDEVYKLTLLGVVTRDTEEYLQHESVTGLEVLDPAEAMTQLLERSENEFGDIVLLAHVGVHRTPDTVTLEDHLAQDTEFSRLITSAPSSVIAILNGHTHDVYSWTQQCPSNECPAADDTVTSQGSRIQMPRGKLSRPIIQAGHHGEWLADIGILVDVESRRAIEVTGSVQPMTTAINDPRYYSRLKNNPVIKSVSDIVSVTLSKEASTLIGSAARSLDHDSRYGETPLCDIVVDGLMEAAIAEGYWVDLALQNPDEVRQGIADGAVLTSDVYNALPLGNQLVIVDLPGEVLRQVLEQQWLPDGSGRRLCHSNNMFYWYDSRRPYGSRIVEDTLIIGNQQFDPSNTYKVVTNDFLSKGGGHFTAMDGQTGIRYLTWIENETLSYYISKYSPVQVTPIPRAIDQAAFIGEYVVFTFSVPSKYIPEGLQYSTEIVFEVVEPYETTSNTEFQIVYDAEIIHTFGYGEIQSQRAYVFNHVIAQRQAGSPDARIMAVARDLVDDPLGFGLLAKPVYHRASAGGNLSDRSLPLIASTSLATLSIHLITAQYFF